MKRIAFIALSMVCMAACASFGKDATKANPFTKVLTAVPAAELPAKAADLVVQATPKVQQATTVNVVKGAVGINPAAALAIAGAMARCRKWRLWRRALRRLNNRSKPAPSQRRRRRQLPAQAAAIVKAVCKAVPKDYRNIAAAVSEAVPGANKEIVNAVEAALPALKPSIDKVLAGYGGNVVSVGDTLDKLRRLLRRQLRLRSR